MTLPEAADINFFSAPDEVKARFKTLPESLTEAKAKAAASAFIAETLPQVIIDHYTR